MTGNEKNKKVDRAKYRKGQARQPQITITPSAYEKVCRVSRVTDYSIKKLASFVLSNVKWKNIIKLLNKRRIRKLDELDLLGAQEKDIKRHKKVTHQEIKQDNVEAHEQKSQ